MRNPFSKADEAENREGSDSTPEWQHAEKGDVDNSKVRLLTGRTIAMGLIVSIGGLIFGYDTGQISGFLQMQDFLTRFADQTDANGDPTFSNPREGTIVGLLSIGTLIGALCSAPIADIFGRRVCIVTWNIMFIIGVIVQIATVDDTWYQVALGRWVAGLGVGGLSVLTPMCKPPNPLTCAMRLLLTLDRPVGNCT